MKNNKKNKKGFSLVEMLVAMFVSTLMILSAVSVFGRMVSARNTARQIQSDLEMTRTALDQMAKNMRMSSGLESRNGDSEVYMLNNSQDRCISYLFDNSAHALMMSEDDAPATGSDCSGVDFVAAGYEPVTKGNITHGRFFVTKTDTTSSPKVIGKATVTLTVDNEKVQTSVSFRDYQDIIQDI